MSKVVSNRISNATNKKINEISEETELTKSFHIQKALETYIEQYADLQIALDRLNDSSDEIISSKEMKKMLES